MMRRGPTVSVWIHVVVSFFACGVGCSIAQAENAQKRREEAAYESSKPFARSKDDADYNKVRRSRERLRDCTCVYMCMCACVCGRDARVRSLSRRSEGYTRSCGFCFISQELADRMIAEDPMFEYMQKKREREEQASGKPMRPKYKGPPPEPKGSMLR